MTTLDEDRLIDYARSHPDGFDFADINYDEGWNRGRFYKAVQGVRLALAEDDTVTLVCEPVPGERYWRYQLIGSLEGEAWWQQNRRGDSMTRLRVERAVNKPIVRGTSGRTIEGRRARMIDRSLTRLIEDLESLDAEFPS